MVADWGVTAAAEGAKASPVTARAPAARAAPIAVRVPLMGIRFPFVVGTCQVGTPAERRGLSRRVRALRGDADLTVRRTYGPIDPRRRKPDKAEIQPTWRGWGWMFGGTESPGDGGPGGAEPGRGGSPGWRGARAGWSPDEGKPGSPSPGGSEAPSGTEHARAESPRPGRPQSGEDGARARRRPGRRVRAQPRAGTRMGREPKQGRKPG
ncbi:hypothetical protein GCM10010236_64990 [Streptomyces eurythermus]|nr:hypothetical protein GCM10010236_64990 [Streptomyces eurythermus]